MKIASINNIIIKISLLRYLLKKTNNNKIIAKIIQIVYDIVKYIIHIFKKKSRGVFCYFFPLKTGIKSLLFTKVKFYLKILVYADLKRTSSADIKNIYQFYNPEGEWSPVFFVSLTRRDREICSCSASNSRNFRGIHLQ